MNHAPVSNNTCMWSADATFSCQGSAVHSPPPHQQQQQVREPLYATAAMLPPGDMLPSIESFQPRKKTDHPTQFSTLMGQTH
jgi:hypothetical protein